MIPRYSRPEMTAIWSDQNRFQIWFDIELASCEKMAALGVIPESVPTSMREKGNFDINRILEIEAEVKHDVIAFLTNVAEYVGEDARFIHQGLTSSDILDTALSVQMVQAVDLLIEGVVRLLDALKTRALEHKYTPTIGRSHGIHAEPTTFGQKLLGFYAEFARNLQRLKQVREEVATCALSGAVGTFATVDPSVEVYVAEKLGLKPEPVSTQVIPRDRHAMFFAVLGVVAGGIERLSTEIRHLQRTEVREAEESFGKKQKGSSAMPHKKNPILTENLTGLARVVRAAVNPAMENIALWHERDISHSSVERVFAPDATITLDFALHRLAGVIENLVVFPETMQKHLNHLKGLPFSQKVLLALTQAGCSREDAYRLVQKNAMKVWDENEQFDVLLLQDTEIMQHITVEQIKEIFDLAAYQKNVDYVFSRVL